MVEGLGRDSTELNDFIVAPSKSITIKRPRGVPRDRAVPIPYEPEDEENEWVSQDMDMQISSTISTIQEKSLKDDVQAYIVLGLTKKYRERKREPKIRILIFDNDTMTILERLSAEILAYLNEEHNKLLVSCPLSALINFFNRKSYDTKYFQQVKRVSTLLYEEQVSDNLRKDVEWKSKPKLVLIQLIPNISYEKRVQYLDEISEYITDSKSTILESDEDGFIIADMNEETTKKLIQISNLVFKINVLPKGIIGNQNHNVGMDITYRDKVQQEINRYVSNEPNLKALPIICLMDSGVNDISPLNRIVFLKDGYLGFPNLDDGCSLGGHGTPIACLASYGEELKEPTSRIISYKLYSDKSRHLVYRGFKQAIRKYSKQTRIFLSSINFDKYNPNATVHLESLIKQNNICMISSAGNINPETIQYCIADGQRHPSYNSDYPVQDPAQSPSIVAIGSITKKESQYSIARSNELSPFSRCGIKYSSLFECPKPEFVQHGGNICYDGTKRGLGVESFKKNGKRNQDFVGTSFSAPLFARIIAKVESKYGSRIQNCETLKAIVFASSRGHIRTCLGYGETNSFNECDRFHALIFSEGLIPLPDTSQKGFTINTQSEITVSIPKFIRRIELFIIHSDNHNRNVTPTLNTILKVKARKTGRDKGFVELANPEELDKKSHMKVFRWAFKSRSMEGDWTFVIRPETTVDLLKEHRIQTVVRYGCAILIMARRTSLYKSITEEIYGLMHQRGYL